MLQIEGIKLGLEEDEALLRQKAAAALRIHDISKQAENLSSEAAASVEKELMDIQIGVESLTMVSDLMEQEMRKFRLNTAVCEEERIEEGTDGP